MPWYSSEPGNTGQQGQCCQSASRCGEGGRGHLPQGANTLPSQGRSPLAFSDLIIQICVGCKTEIQKTWCPED